MTVIFGSCGRARLEGGTGSPTFLDDADSESGDDTIRPVCLRGSLALEPKAGAAAHLNTADSDRDTGVANWEIDRASCKPNKPTDPHRGHEHVADINARMAAPPVPDQTAGDDPVNVHGLERWAARLAHHYPGDHVLGQVEVAWPASLPSHRASRSGDRSATRRVCELTAPLA